MGRARRRGGLGPDHRTHRCRLSGAVGCAAGHRNLSRARGRSGGRSASTAPVSADQPCERLRRRHVLLAVSVALSRHRLRRCTASRVRSDDLDRAGGHRRAEPWFVLRRRTAIAVRPVAGGPDAEGARSFDIRTGGATRGATGGHRARSPCCDLDSARGMDAGNAVFPRQPPGDTASRASRASGCVHWSGRPHGTVVAVRCA